MREALNGTKTHPLSKHAINVLREVARRPCPRQEINAGVNDRLEREYLTETFKAPSPYKTHKGALIVFVRITEKGKARLEEIALTPSQHSFTQRSNDNEGA